MLPPEGPTGVKIDLRGDRWPNLARDVCPPSSGVWQSTIKRRWASFGSRITDGAHACHAPR